MPDLDLDEEPGRPPDKPVRPVRPVGGNVRDGELLELRENGRFEDCQCDRDEKPAHDDRGEEPQNPSPRGAARAFRLDGETPGPEPDGAERGKDEAPAVVPLGERRERNRQKKDEEPPWKPRGRSVEKGEKGTKAIGFWAKTKQKITDLFSKATMFSIAIAALFFIVGTNLFDNCIMAIYIKH